MEYKDYYAILGLDKKALPDDIKHAYRRLARKYHPDVSKEANAEEQFKNVQEAYEVLKDPEKRTAYDQLGSNWRQGQEFRPPPNWDEQTRFYRHGNTGGFAESDFGGFSEFFSNLFGRGRARQSEGGGYEGFQQRGRDQHAMITISLEEAYRGTSKKIQLQIPEMDASGAVHHKLRTLNVTIPAGAESGQQLRLAGQGGGSMGGAPNGDLYLEIDIQPHRLFSLQGRDVYLTLPLTPWEAVLGTEIKIPTLGGPVGLKVASGTRAGQKLRLKGRGMPGKPHSGDQYAVVQVEVPPVNTEEQKQLFKKMGETISFNPRKDWPV